MTVALLILQKTEVQSNIRSHKAKGGCKAYACSTPHLGPRQGLGCQAHPNLGIQMVLGPVGTGIMELRVGKVFLPWLW